MFDVWKDPVFKIAGQKYKHFDAITYAKIVDETTGKISNYKVTFNVGDKDDTDPPTIVVEVYV